VGGKTAARPPSPTWRRLSDEDFRVAQSVSSGGINPGPRVVTAPLVLSVGAALAALP
jgi:hypothetical protein